MASKPLGFPREVPHQTARLTRTLRGWRLVLFPGRSRLRWAQGAPVGLCDYDPKVIQVAGKSPESPFWTVVHESLHASLPHLSEDAVLGAEMAVRSALEAYVRLTGQEIPE